MSRAIDADALIPMMKYATTDSEIGVFPIKIGFNDIEKVINEQPTIEPEPHWIPCSERLPEDEYVLISKKPTMISGDKWCVAIAIRTADPRSRKIQWRDSGFGVIQDDKVLAWMPLPDPYREGEG